MVKYKWEDLRGDNIPFVGQLAKGARTFACKLWNKYPDRFAGSDPLFAPAKFFWNTVCAEEGINKQPEPPPFQGGQCPVMYNVKVYSEYYNTTSCVRLQPFEFTDQFRGPIGIPYFQRFEPPQSTNTQCFGAGIVYAGQWILPTGEGLKVLATGVYESPLSNFYVMSVSRVDGQPDNCGSLPTNFPPSLLPEPGEENEDVIFNDGNDIDLTVPLSWFDIDFSVPLTFNFEVGDIVIDVGGVTVNFNINNNWNLEDIPDTVKLPDTVNDQLDDIQDTIKTVDGILEEEKKKFNKTEYDDQVFNTCSFLEYTNSDVDYVEIIVTQFPVKGKMIVNNNLNDTFFWAGYFCWTVGNSRTTHVVVQKTSNFYKRPDWATGFSFFCVNDACAQINVYTKKIVPAN